MRTPVLTKTCMFTKIPQGQYPADKCPLKEVKNFTVPLLREHTKELPAL